MKKLINKKETPLYYIVYNKEANHYSHGALSIGQELGTNDRNEIYEYRDLEKFLQEYFDFTGIDIKEDFEIDK